MNLKELIRSRKAHARRAKARTADAKRHRGLARENRKLGIRQRQIVRKRTKQIREKRQPHGARAAVSWALAQVGTVEQPANSNWGPKISDWIKASGYGYGVPWCQCFVNAAAVKGGAPQLKTGYTPTVLRGLNGYKPVPAGEARAGDFVFFKFPGVSNDSCDHVGLLTEPPSGGLVRTVEGNTSSGQGGSQNNGGGVFARTRSTSIVAGYVRPPYPKG